MISVDMTKQIIENEDEGPALDYKEDLPLETDGDKAKFVKDVISLANSGQTAHIITGVQDGTRKLIGIKTHHAIEKLNEILKDKSDPPLRIEYVERNIMGHTIGIIEIKGENPPYIVAVHDRYGGHLSSDPQKPFYIERGTVFIRNYNINEGAKRPDLDKIYNKIKYVALQADLELTHEVATKPSGDLVEANIKFFLGNRGDAVATDAYVWMQFKNVKEIMQCTEAWDNISAVNDAVPTIQLVCGVPVIRRVRTDCGGVIIKVDRNIKRIDTEVIICATNMRTKEGSYAIPLKKKGK